MKNLAFRVFVDGIDGVSTTSYEGDSLSGAKDFLEKMDHEGSSVCVQVMANDHEAYELLKAIDAYTQPL